MRLSKVSTSDSKKMRFAVPLLFVILQLVESTVGSCRLRATVRTIIAEEKQGISQEPVHQTRLQLQCDSGDCPATNFTTCNTYTDLGISPDCTDSHCSRLFNLCENSCINGQEPLTDPEEAPANSKPSISHAIIELSSLAPTPVNVCPTDISCTPTTTVHTVTVPTNTCSTTRQSSCITINPTTTKIQKIYSNITHTTTITASTPYPRNTTELAATTATMRPFQNNSCNISTSIKFIRATVLLTVKSLCTPIPSQFTPRPEKNNCSTVSLVLGACSCSEPGTPTTKANPNATSALGALLGISMVILALVTAGWVWTCWTFKKRGGITVNSKLNNFPNTLGTVTINNNTDTLRRLQNPLYEDTVLNGLPPPEVDLQTGHGDNSEETGPTYEIIPLPAIVNKKASKENGNIPQEKDGEETAGGGVSGGVASSINDDIQDNIGSVGGDKMNIYFLPDEKTKEERSERTGDTDQGNNYHLLGNAEEMKKEGVRESVYHILKSPLDDVDEDYADPDEDEMNNIYHILEGPTPEREEERERDEVEGEEPLTEPTAYEVPVASNSKHNSIVQ